MICRSAALPPGAGIWSLNRSGAAAVRRGTLASISRALAASIRAPRREPVFGSRSTTAIARAVAIGHESDIRVAELIDILVVAHAHSRSFGCPVDCANNCSPSRVTVSDRYVTLIWNWPM